VIDDVRRRVPSGFAPGRSVHLLGTTHEELSGSEWAHVVHGHLGGMPPVVDLEAERALAELLAEGCRQGLLASAHDLSDGGLAQALVEACLRRGVGARVDLPGDPFVALFSESAGRVLVTVGPEDEDRLVALAAAHGVPQVRLGETAPPGDAGRALEVVDNFTVPLEELSAAWRGTIPAAMS
jgi:phosphoribosylformylglycinamidine synthase